MNSNVVVRSEKLVLVEATGKRTQIGEIIFTKRDGYKYPVAEMDITVALPLIRGERLTEKTRDEFQAKLKEVEEENAKIDEANKRRPPNTNPYPHVKVPEEYHGHFVNFRMAEPWDGKDDEDEESVDSVEEGNGDELSEMKWTDLRKLAAEHGISITKKTRPQIEEELAALIKV